MTHRRPPRHSQVRRDSQCRAAASLVLSIYLFIYLYVYLFIYLSLYIGSTRYIYIQHIYIYI